jgi:hypothetical protein
MEWTRGVKPKGRKLKGGLHDAGEFAFRLLRGLTEHEEQASVCSHVDPMLSEKEFDGVVDHTIVTLITTKTQISRTRAHLTDATAYVEEGNLTRPTPPVNDHNRLAVRHLRGIQQGRCRRFVDELVDVQPGEGPSVTHGLPLDMGERGGDSNDCFVNPLTQQTRRIFSHLAQQASNTLLGCIETSVCSYAHGIARPAQ